MLTNPIYIYPYKQSLESVKQLKEAFIQIEAFPPKIIKHINKIPNNSIIINWGNSEVPQVPTHISLYGFNTPPAVELAANKLFTFLALKDKVNIPWFTKNIDEVKNKISNDGSIIIGRTLLSSHSGQGIIILDKNNVEEELPKHNFKLFTQYQPKSKEFRVHVFGEKVIDVQEKRIKSNIDKENVNKKIRSYNNGWVFCRENIEIPENLFEQSILAVRYLKLDFGAVDIIWSKKENKCYIIEINTAPGLQGQTAINYAKEFVKRIGENFNGLY